MLSGCVCTGEALGIGASELVLRSPLGSPNAHVHFSTGSAARRYLLRLEVTTHPDHPCRMLFTFVSTHVAVSAGRIGASEAPLSADVRHGAGGARRRPAGGIQGAEPDHVPPDARGTNPATALLQDRLTCVDFLMLDEAQTCLVFDCVACGR